MKFDLQIDVITSYYLKKIALKYGFTIAEELTFVDYRDPITNEAIFSSVPAPHTGAILAYKYMSTSNTEKS